MTTLLNARALIVGASGVLGHELANECTHRGAHVVGTAFSSSSDEVASTEVVADITSSEGRSQILSAVEAMGGVDIVVIAAGVVGFGTHDAVTPDEISLLINVDLIAPLQILSELSPHISEGGNVTVLTGAVVDVSTLGMSAYTAAKAGLSAAMSVIRREMRSRKITVLDARPPHTETGLAQRAIFGAAPALKAGLPPAQVARRIVDAIENNETELTPAAFAT
jgi:cyclic-di-GMP-binding biofilm dispersal mediator protein